jgi:hypothetical protein
MDDNLPAPLPSSRPIDRAALERVLGRAAELQAGGSDTRDVLSEADLIEIGREVGLAPEHLRQALAEERKRVTLEPESGVAARLAGPAQAVASRVVNGTPAAVLAALDAWMQREECLQVKRRYGERLTWERRRDLMSSVMRGMNLGGRGYALARATEVGATVTAVDASRVLVRLDADLALSRRQRLAGGGVAVGGGVASGGALAVTALVANASLLVLPLALIPVALGAGIGYAVARSHRGAVTRLQVALEQVLDRLEHGELKRAPSLLDVLAKR